MASNYTEHYRLCQWEPGDSFIRAEFNGDNGKVDAALHRKAEQADLTALAGAVGGKADQSALNALTAVVNGKADQTALNNLIGTVNGKGQFRAGFYAGNGNVSQYIGVGFTPQAVLVEQAEGNRSQGGNYTGVGGLAVAGHDMIRKSSSILGVTAGGFNVYSRGEFVGELNGSGQIYHYVAFG